MLVMLQVSATIPVGVLTVMTVISISFGETNRGSRNTVLHTVCYDAEGAIDISNKRNYPVVSNAFSVPTKSTKLKGTKASQKHAKKAFWQITFKMPAIVTEISIIAENLTQPSNIRLQFLNKSANVKHELGSYLSKSSIINHKGLDFKNVHFFRVEKIGKGTLSFTDIKFKGTQAPESTDCVSNVKAFPGGCYSLYFWQVYKVDYRCERGFRFEGTKTIWPCSENPGNTLKCRKLQLRCSAPPGVSNSLHSVTQRKYYEDEIVRYNCELGYYLVGPSKITCTRSGSWNPSDKPQCLRDSQCPTPDVPLNGGKRGFNYRVNSNVTFYCYPGYELIGPNSIQCTREQQWQPNTTVTCQAIRCPAVKHNSVTNGKVKLRELNQPGFTYGNHLQIICNKGYKIVGNEIITCRGNGTWDSNLPNCTAINKSGPCSLRPKPCRRDKECVVTSNNESKCVCSASLGHGCLNQILPMCISKNITFWSECHMMNYTCLHPDEQFSILRFSPCDEGGIRKVTVETASGIDSRYVYKCSLRQKGGSCKALTQRYYFDQDENRCLSYDWGGCDPNGNNFDSLAQCEQDCKDFQSCNRNEKHDSNSGKNLAKDRPTHPSNILSASFVDGSRIYNETVEHAFSKWNVSLLRRASISKIIVWNSDYSLPWLKIILRDGGLVVWDTRIDRKGLCRYDLAPSSSVKATSVSLETSASSSLHVDEVEVITTRGKRIDFRAIGARAEQHPGTAQYKPQNRNLLRAAAENAINGRFEQHSGGGEGFLSCSSTLLERPSERHWLQVDLKRAYFITEIELLLRNGSHRREWQRGLTVHLTNTSLSSGSNASSLLHLSNRCGEPYTSPENQTPVFPCFFPYTSRYAVFTLFPLHDAGLQVCEIQVFAVACNDLTAIDHVKVHSRIDSFAPSTTSYSCKQGYYPVSSGMVKCGRNGRWLTQNGKEPFCEQTQPTSISSHYTT